MRSRDPLANVIAPVPDQLPASPANGPAPWARLDPTPGGTDRTAAARTAALRETAGTSRTNSRRRIVRSEASAGGASAWSARQLEYVIEVSVPAGDEGYRLRHSVVRYPSADGLPGRWIYANPV